MHKFIQYCLSIPTETRTIEFKRLGTKSVVRKVLRSIVAMSNTDGGLLVFGIDDPEKGVSNANDRIFGIEENLEVYDEIGKEIRNIIPPITGIWPPQLVVPYDDERRVAGLFVPKATESFHSWGNQVLVRLEKGVKTLSPAEIVKFSYIKGFSKADRELVDVDLSLLDTPLLKEWSEARQIAQKGVDDLLFRTGLARKNGEGELKPTRAAVLLFSDFPNDILDDKTSIKISQYTGSLERIQETPNLIGVPKIINGPLIKQISEAHDYILNILRTGVRIPSGFVTQYRIPERSVKEAVTNAVIHRDYHTKRDIEIRIFEDRMEVISPGLLPYNITPKNIGRERADNYRNDLLVKHLREFPSPPNLDQNEGVRAMRAEMHSANMYPPLFWTYPHSEDSVSVVLFNEERATEWERVDSFLQKKGGYINNTKVRELTGIADRSKVSRLLKKWVERGFLKRYQPSTGGYKNVRYALNDDAPDQRAMNE